MILRYGVLSNINFSPIGLSNLIFYYDSTSNGIVFNGSKVAQWNDLSGNGLHLSQSNPTYQPTFDSNELIFSTNYLERGSDLIDLVRNDLSGEIIYVVKRNGNGYARSFTLVNSSNELQNFFQGVRIDNNTPPATLRLQKPTSSIAKNNLILSDVYNVISFSSNGTEYYYRINNNTDKNNWDNGVNNGDWVGDGLNKHLLNKMHVGYLSVYDSMSLKALLYFSRRLTTVERDNVFNYLNQKHNVY